MEVDKLGDYLNNPAQIQIALDFLDSQSGELTFLELFKLFQEKLGIKDGEGFPITRAYISDTLCRARVHENGFVKAKDLNDIGTKKTEILQGRANPTNLPIFYASNSVETTIYEVLQDKPPGEYKITIGNWLCSTELNLVNLIDGSDADFDKVKFAHSMPMQYLESWPEIPKKSATMLFQYFSKKFKQRYYSGLYDITNVIAGNFYSLDDIDGILYGATSNKFKGVNLALLNTSKIRCDLVEEWLIIKHQHNEFNYECLKTGLIQENGIISW